MALIYIRVHSGMPSALGLEGYCHTYVSFHCTCRKKFNIEHAFSCHWFVFWQCQNVHLLSLHRWLACPDCPPQGGSAADGPVHHREHSLLNCPKTLLHTRVWVPLLDCIESVMYKEHPRATSITCQCCAEHVQTFTQAVYQ